MDFSATAGDNIGFALSNLVTANNPSNVYTYIYKPDGTLLTYSGNCAPPGCALAYSNLPQTGIYGVIVQPHSAPAATMSFTATVSHDQVTPLSLAVPANINLTRPGQTGRLTFSATAATTLVLQISSIATTPASKSVNFVIYQPNGTQLSSALITTGYTFNVANLPSTGTYTLLISPTSGALATMTVNLTAQ